MKEGGKEPENAGGLLLSCGFEKGRWVVEGLVRHQRKCCMQFWVLRLKEKLIQTGNEAQKSGRWPEPYKHRACFF